MTSTIYTVLTYRVSDWVWKPNKASAGGLHSHQQRSVLFHVNMTNHVITDENLSTMNQVQYICWDKYEIQ